MDGGAGVDAPGVDASGVDAPGVDAFRPDGGGGCAPGTTECGGRCVDLGSDPSHCGACGRVCAAPRAMTSCVAGACAVGACESGWLDCDGLEENGCERPDGCVEGASCTTACDSAGVIACPDRCAPVCMAPAEICNHADDDCDGSCESGLAGCRAGVHRAFGNGGHLYTRDLGEAMSGGHMLERENFYWVYTSEHPGLRAFYRCRKTNGLRFYTTSSACEGGGTSEGVLGYVAAGETCGATALYRLYSSSAGNHFYTTSAAERDNAVASFGYRYESIAGYVWTGS